MRIKDPFVCFRFSLDGGERGEFLVWKPCKIDTVQTTSLTQQKIFAYKSLSISITAYTHTPYTEINIVIHRTQNRRWRLNNDLFDCVSEGNKTVLCLLLCSIWLLYWWTTCTWCEIELLKKVVYRCLANSTSLWDILKFTFCFCTQRF